MSTDHRQAGANKTPQAEGADKGSGVFEPDEARMGEIAKRLLSVPPEKTKPRGAAKV